MQCIKGGRGTGRGLALLDFVSIFAFEISLPFWLRTANTLSSSTPCTFYTLPAPTPLPSLAPLVLYCCMKAMPLPHSLATPQSNASRLFVLSRVFMAYASLALRSSFTTASRIVYIPRYSLCNCVCVCVFVRVYWWVSYCMQTAHSQRARERSKEMPSYMKRLRWEGELRGVGERGEDVWSWEASCIH